MNENKKTVLIVDDTPDNIKLLKHVLEDENYSVKVANSGKRCLDIVDKKPYPDLILLDIMMPEMSGYEVCRKIKENIATKDIPIIFITAKNEIEDEEYGFKLGAVDYITKPISVPIVLARVKTHINLKDLVDNLTIKVKKETELRVHQEKILMQKSKMAAMGEIIDAIAHQWKQPLTVIGLYGEMLKLEIKDNEQRESILEYIEKTKKQINHLDNTINEFRSFFRPNEKLENFSLSEAVENVLLLLKDELIKNTIVVEKNLNRNIIISGNINEFKHILINFINNAKDAFNQNEISKRVIKINLYIHEKNNEIILEIIDNAGGIPENIIDDIFKPNVTTKENIGGTGIGLYLSKQIADKMDGKLSVENVQDGAKFIFTKMIKNIL